MGKKCMIVLVEDHAIVRQGFRTLLSSNPDFEIVGECEDGLDAIRCVDKLKPDLVFMDLTLPKLNGLEAIRDIKKQCPQTKIIVLTAHSTDEFIHAAFEAGANGYVSKHDSYAEMEIAIKSVLKGKTYISPEVSTKVVEGYLEGTKTSRWASRWDTLTKREREILQLIAEGRKNTEIANCLFISVKTVESHRTNLMKKLDLHNSSALTAFAKERGLI
jgi:DNA-binding NarL/FixJ family response regulator